MASSFRSYVIPKYYKLGPLDLRSSLTNRDPSFAQSMKNMMRGRKDSLTIRPGNQIVLGNQQCPGPQKGIFEFEDIPHFCSDNTLWKLTQPQIQFHNVSLGAASVMHNIISNQWNFRVAQDVTSPTNLLASDGFETGTYASFWTSDYPLAANYDPTIPGVLRYQTSVKRTGSYAIRYHLLAAGPDDQEPFKLTVEAPKFAALFGSANQDEMYVEFCISPAAGFPWPLTGQKLCRIGYDDGVGPTNYVCGILVQGNNSDIQLRTFRQDLADDKFVNVATPIPDTTWTKFGVYVRINTAGVADGVASLYWDGVRVAHITNMMYRTAGQPSFNYFWVGGNSSNGGSPPATDGDLYFDDIKVYTSIPAFVTASSNILDENLGTGIEANPYTLYSLQQAVLNSCVGAYLELPATPDYGELDAKSLPAAFIPKAPLVTTQSGNTVPIPYYVPRSLSWEGGASSGAFYSSRTTFGSLGIPCYPTQVVNDVAYIGAKEKLCKYDSANVTSAGLRAPDQVTLTAAAGGSANGTYQYLLTFSRVDAYGNEIESDPYLSAEVTTAGAQKITLSDLEGRAGWRPDFDEATEPWGAVIQGGQAPTVSGGQVTFTMDNGFGGLPRLDIGDPVYLKRNEGGLYDSYYLQGRVTAVSGHSVTLDNPRIPFTEGVTWTVSDNAPVAPGIILNIYRTQTGPSALFYRVAGIPIDVTSPTQSYDDTLADSSLGAEYVFPEVSRTPFSLQPQNKLGYYPAINALGLYRGSLLVGIGSTIKFSDIESPEYFPSANAFTFNQFDSSEISGFGPRENHFLAFKQNSCAIIAGEIVTGQYSVDLVSDSIGCVSPFTIHNIGGQIYWVDKSGIYRQAEGGKPEMISLPIQPVFESAYSAIAAQWTPRTELLGELVVCSHDSELKQYIAYIPYGYYTLSFLGDDVPSKTPVIVSTRVLVFNYEREEYYEWDNVEQARGTCELTDRGILAGGRELNPLTNSINYLIRKKLTIGGKYDYSDGANPIVWSYESSPETLGEPAVEKKAVKARIESLDPDDAQDFSVRFRLNQTRFPGSTDTTKNITSTVRTALVKIKKQRGTSHSFTLSGSSTNEKPVVTGVQIEYSASFQPFVRKED